MTLRVYWHILGLDKNESIGVRSIQRALGLSSPSVASHHLEKLKTPGLLEKDTTGEYRLIGLGKGGKLQNFMGFFGGLCPGHLFHFTKFTAKALSQPLIFSF